MNSSLPDNWTVTTLGTCANWYSGGTPSTSVAEYWNGSIPWISASSLHEFYVNDSERKVTELGVNNGTRLMPENSILFVVRGMSLKSEFRIGITKRPVAFGQDCKALVVKSEITPLFLANVLRSKSSEILSMVDEASHGTGRLQTSTLERLEIPLPPLSEQEVITEYITALDDKIDLNRQINETLEAIAQTIFQSWFVDFDPVHEPTLAGEYADLFERGFSDEGIPAGWRYGTIKEIMNLSRDSIKPGNFPNKIFDHYSIPAFDEGKEPKQDIGQSIRSNKYKVYEDAVLISKLNPHTPRIWLPKVELSRHSVCSTEFFVNRPSSDFSREFIYCLLSSHQFNSKFVGLVTGTSGSHQRVKPKDFVAMSILIPDKKTVEAFTTIVRSLLEQTAYNVGESRTLAELRDTLLPKLISGQLRIPDATQIVEEST